MELATSLVVQTLVEAEQTDKLGRRAATSPVIGRWVIGGLARYGASEAVLVAWGVDTDGGKHLLCLAVGNKESEDCWTGFFRGSGGDGQTRAIRDPPTLDVARAQADRAIHRYHSEFPSRGQMLGRGSLALLAVHRVPVRHRIDVRTTNLAEPSFVEERRHAMVIPRMLDEKSAMKLVFAP